MAQATKRPAPHRTSTPRPTRARATWSVKAITGGADDAFTLVATYSGAAGQLRTFAKSAQTYVEGNVNGDRNPDLPIVISGVHSLHGPDVVL